MTPSLDDTICSLATPPGVGGIGVIRVSGPQAFAVTDAVTKRPRDVPSASYAGHTLHRADVLAYDGSVIDDVLLAIFHAPRSYTGENVVEISAHGGPVPLRRILSRLLTSGARLAQPGEFTQRAYLNGKMDLAQAEAVGDIIAARTDEALTLARSQQSGRLSAEVAEIRHLILRLMALIEAS
ncbi:MAG: trmE, partial [Capsulimonas sp.]|nr:trmE [Capsulimonas sp.]